MNKLAYVVINKDHKIFVLILVISFSIFIFTASGHRFGSDEYLAFVQAKRILDQTPDPNFVLGETRPGLQGTSIDWSWPVCKDAILCSGIPIGYAASYIPFIFFEQNLHVIPNYVFTESDFYDSHYVSWRNSLTREETFTYLFYGPTITALSAAILFLIARTYDYKRKTCTIISFLYSFTTMAWAYSNTGTNVVLATVFILLAFFFFRKFKKHNTGINLIFCGVSLGISFLIRYDTAIFSIILIAFLIYEITKRSQKVKNIINLTGPLVFCALIFAEINFIRFGSFLEFGYGSEKGLLLDYTTTLHMGIFGLLFSPCCGLFIFSPILLTVFLSFADFYGKDKNDFIIFLSYFISLLIFFGSLNNWHGLVSWGSRYMIPIIPFLILPLASSIEKRKNVQFRISLFILGVIGAFFSFIWLIQDVSWFVWGTMGDNRGLFSLGVAGMHPLNLNPIVFWTFSYSQLTQAIILAFTNLHVDLFLLKVLGLNITFFILSLIMIPSSFFLVRLLKDNNDIELSNSKRI